MGSGSKNGGSGSPDALDQQIYDQFHEAGASGAEYFWGGDPTRERAARMGYDAGVASVPAAAPDYASMFSGMMESQANMMQNYQQQNAEAQAAAEQEAYAQRIDTLYSQKFAAANAAIDEVEKEIADMAAYAATGGADFSIDPATKKEKINNVFAKYWSAEQESTLTGLESKWGSGGNKWTSGIVRGVAPGEDTEDTEDPVQAGSRVVLGSNEEEDKLGSSGQLLGSA